MSEIKVGDRVRVNPRQGYSYAESNRGEEYTVTRVSHVDADKTAKLDTSPEREFWQADLELVTPELSFDAYDPSMLPMLGKLVDLAERNSWCPEFDKALAEIGAPDRAEIKRLTTPEPVEPEMPLGIYCAKVYTDTPQSSILWRHNDRGWFALASQELGSADFHADHPRDHFSHKREPWWEQITLLTAVEL